MDMCPGEGLAHVCAHCPTGGGTAWLLVSALSPCRESALRTKPHEIEQDRWQEVGG